MEYLYIERVAYRYGGDAAALSGDLLLGIAVDVLLTRLPVMGFSTVTLDCRQPSLRFVGMVSFTPLDPRIQLAFIDSLPKLCRMCIFCGGINLYFCRFILLAFDLLDAFIGRRKLLRHCAAEVFNRLPYLCAYGVMCGVGIFFTLHIVTAQFFPLSASHRINWRRVRFFPCDLKYADFSLISCAYEYRRLLNLRIILYTRDSERLYSRGDHPRPHYVRCLHVQNCVCASFDGSQGVFDPHLNG